MIKHSIAKYIFDIKDRDHIAINYSNSEQMDEVVINFTLRGLASNQINFWFVQQNEKDHWLEILKKKGVDVNQLIDSHELIIVEHTKFLSNAILTPFDLIMSNLYKVKNIVKNKQKFGINAIGTLSGNLYSQKRFAECINIARNWHKVVESFEIPITLLCPYYSMTEEHKLDLIKIHNAGILTLEENSDTHRTFGNKERKNYTEEKNFQNLESEIFPKKELAIFNSLNEIISIMREKEIVQQNETVNKKDIPAWYFNLIESLNKLYISGYDNAHKENEDLK
jgi:DcmR-like sensory protein